MGSLGSNGITVLIMIISFILIAVTAASMLSDETNSMTTEQNPEDVLDETLDEICSYLQIKDDVKAVVGIGTLIVFIAMILIAAVASSVLITTSEELQARAKTVGTQTIREVSAGISVESVTGYTNAAKTHIEYLACTIRPRAGSKDIDLSLCTLSVLYDNLTILTLNEALVNSVNTDNTSVFYTPVESGSNYTIMGNTSNTTFAVIAIHDPDGSITATYGMNSGDRAILLINLSSIIDVGGLPARETVSGMLTPEIGIKAQYDVTAPAVFSKRIVKLD